MTTPPDNENAPGQLQLTEGESENHLAAGLAPQPSSTGVDLAAANRDAWWWSGAWRGVQEFADGGRPFTAWDLTDQLGLPDPDHPARWGALFNQASRQGLIEAIGYAPSRRPSSGGVTRVWRGRRAA